MILSKHKALIIFFLLSFRVVTAENVLPTPAFDNETEIFSNTGHYKLLWKVETSEIGAIEFELQRARDSTFTDALTIYKGPDLGSFISGLKNGRYFFRVRAIDGSMTGTWSPTTILEVAHHSLKMAFTLFGIGAVVFLLTAGMLIQGVRKTKKEEL